MEKMKMRYRTTFIGDLPPFLDVIKKCSDLHLIVSERVKGKRKRYFGSAFDYARENNIQVVSPKDYLNHPIETDIIIVSGYPKLLPLRIIQHPRIGIVNIHPSLLPAYRGRHPLNWAIINGEKYTGITIHHVNEKFDDGNIIVQGKVPIDDDDTIMDVYLKTVKEGRELLRKMFEMVGTKEFEGFEQSRELASHFPPRKPKDGKIDWDDSAVKIKNLVRALVEPYPGAYFYLKRRKVIVERAEVLESLPHDIEIEKGKPFLVDGNCVVRTGKGFLKIAKVRNKNLDLSDVNVLGMS